MDDNDEATWTEFFKFTEGHYMIKNKFFVGEKVWIIQDSAPLSLWLDIIQYDDTQEFLLYTDNTDEYQLKEAEIFATKEEAEASRIVKPKVGDVVYLSSGDYFIKKTVSIVGSDNFDCGDYSSRNFCNYRKTWWLDKETILADLAKKIEEL